jgi:hypothetical protein
MRLKSFLTVLLMAGSVWPLNALGRQNEPLSPAELREGTLRIEQYILGLEEARLLRESISREQAFADKERGLAARELDTEKARTALAEMEVELQRETAEFYKKAFAATTKGRTFGCWVKKFFTLGNGKCA